MKAFIASNSVLLMLPVLSSRKMMSSGLVATAASLGLSPVQEGEVYGISSPLSLGLVQLLVCSVLLCDYMQYNIIM